MTHKKNSPLRFEKIIINLQTNIFLIAFYYSKIFFDFRKTFGLKMKECPQKRNQNYLRLVKIISKRTTRARKLTFILGKI